MKPEGGVAETHPRDYMSDRLHRRLVRDGFSRAAIDRLRLADFSGGRAPSESEWARHNERVHVAIVLASPVHGFDSAFALAELDWRDALIAGGLADGGWDTWLDGWFAQE